MRDRLIFAMACAMASLFAVASADESFTREEVAHAFGTDPDGTHYPQTAVDTEDVPNVVLKASERRDAPLRY